MLQLINPDTILDPLIYFCLDEDGWQELRGIQLNTQIYNGQRLKYHFSKIILKTEKLIILNYKLYRRK